MGFIRSKRWIVAVSLLVAGSFLVAGTAPAAMAEQPEYICRDRPYYNCGGAW